MKLSRENPMTWSGTSICGLSRIQTKFSFTTSSRSHREMTPLVLPQRLRWPANNSVIFTDGLVDCLFRIPFVTPSRRFCEIGPIRCRCHCRNRRRAHSRHRRSGRRRPWNSNRKAFALHADRWIHPARNATDRIGCRNQQRRRLNDPEYLGWRHERIRDRLITIS